MLKHVFGLFILLLLGHQQANGHGGKLDVSGCHNDLNTETYHCHQGKYAGSHSQTKDHRERLEDREEEPNGSGSTDQGVTPLQLSGQVYVVDGDSIKFGNTRVRLFGIDAPEIKQTCDIAGRSWNCGIEARRALVRAIDKYSVSCVEKDRDRYGRVVAVCLADGVNLNSFMVSEGWALAYRRYSRDYEHEESTARAGKLGLWQGRFTPPWDWRRSQRR